MVQFNNSRAIDQEISQLQNALPQNLGNTAAARALTDRINSLTAQRDSIRASSASTNTTSNTNQTASTNNTNQTSSTSSSSGNSGSYTGNGSSNPILAQAKAMLQSVVQKTKNVSHNPTTMAAVYLGVMNTANQAGAMALDAITGGASDGEAIQVSSRATEVAANAKEAAMTATEQAKADVQHEKESNKAAKRA